MRTTAARIGRTLGVRPPETLDETAARESPSSRDSASSSRGRSSRRATATRLRESDAAVTGEVIATATAARRARTQVLGVATELVAAVRRALGDDDIRLRTAVRDGGLSATSLDVVRDYAAAHGSGVATASSRKHGRASEGRGAGSEVRRRLPLLAVASRNLGQLQDAEKYINEALRHLDGMTERERYATRGIFYCITGDYQECVKEYGDLIARFVADASARNQLAFARRSCETPRAVDEMRQVVRLLPKRALFRENLALYAALRSDFQTAEQEARGDEEPDAWPAGARVRAARTGPVGQAQRPTTRSAVDELGVSVGLRIWATSPSIEGRFADAVRLLEQGAAADTAREESGPGGGQARRARVCASPRGQKRQPSRRPKRRWRTSKASKIRFLAARVFVEAGETAKAASSDRRHLAAELQAEPQAYAKILEGKIALESGDAREAIKLLHRGQHAAGYVDRPLRARPRVPGAGVHQADSEFDRCLKRRAKRSRCCWTKSPRSGISRRFTTTRAASAK